MERFELDRLLPRLVCRAARSFDRDVGRRFFQAGLPVTLEQWPVLVNLFARDGLTQSELCLRLVREKTVVSRLVDGLEGRGLVRRERDEHDARVRRVHLTREGRALEGPCMAEVRAVLREACRDIDPGELDICRRVLARVQANLSGGEDAAHDAPAEDSPDRPAAPAGPEA